MKKKTKKKSKIWNLAKADKEFSEYIRSRDGKCMRCGKQRGPDNPLTCSHFWGRQHKATRFDPKNCVSACWMPCHKYYWEKEKQGDYRDFMLSWLGQKEYAALEKRARSIYPQLDAIIDCQKLLTPSLLET